MQALASSLFGHVVLALTIIAVREPRSQKRKRALRWTLATVALGWSMATTIWVLRRRGPRMGGAYAGTLLLTCVVMSRLLAVKPAIDQRWFGVVYLVCVCSFALLVAQQKYAVQVKVLEQSVLGDGVDAGLVTQVDQVVQGGPQEGHAVLAL